MSAEIMKKYTSGLLQVHMRKLNRILVLSLFVSMTAWITFISQASAQDLTAPTRVISEYLNSLANGDTSKIAQLIDGRMKQNNRQLELNPETYSQFLKTNYAEVQMTIEEIAADGTGVWAKVRFDYPSQGSSSIEFLLTENNGLWKITDEVY